MLRIFLEDHAASDFKLGGPNCWGLQHSALGCHPLSAYLRPFAAAAAAKQTAALHDAVAISAGSAEAEAAADQSTRPILTG
mmetsp:Transcript_72971/g.159554  ORF Transcript_72971/g.159554 Transcript_72971/m.159554 type:complete len:81 (-) Transcript_72971:108-350(-)